MLKNLTTMFAAMTTVTLLALTPASAVAQSKEEQPPNADMQGQMHGVSMNPMMKK